MLAVIFERLRLRKGHVGVGCIVGVKGVNNFDDSILKLYFRYFKHSMVLYLGEMVANFQLMPSLRC